MKNFKKLILLALVLGTQFALAENGVSDDEVVIGQFAAVSGPAALLGQRMQLGMQTYFNVVNSQGGVNGRAIKLLTRDDGYEPAKAKEAVRSLINDHKVFALAGSVGTPTGIAALPILTDEKIPLVGMFTGAQALRDPFNRYVFHVRASYFDETERIVQYLTTVGVKKIAVFYENDSYGQAGLEGVLRALAKRNLKPEVTATVERNTVNVANALEAILKASPEAVIQVGAYKSCAALIKQSRAKGYGGQFFNVSFVGSKALSDELGDAGQGVVISQVVPFPYVPNKPIVREYQRHMTEAGQKEFDFSTLEGYLTARIMVEGLKRAGRNLTRENLIRGLESMKDFNLGGFVVNYSPKNHMGSNFIDLTIIGRGGKFVH